MAGRRASTGLKYGWSMPTSPVRRSRSTSPGSCSRRVAGPSPRQPTTRRWPTSRPAGHGRSTSSTTTTPARSCRSATTSWSPRTQRPVDDHARRGRQPDLAADRHPVVGSQAIARTDAGDLLVAGVRGSGDLRVGRAAPTARPSGPRTSIVDRRTSADWSAIIPTADGVIIAGNVRRATTAVERPDTRRARRCRRPAVGHRDRSRSGGRRRDDRRRGGDARRRPPGGRRRRLRRSRTARSTRGTCSSCGSTDAGTRRRRTSSAAPTATSSPASPSSPTARTPSAVRRPPRRASTTTLGRLVRRRRRPAVVVDLRRSPRRRLRHGHRDRRCRRRRLRRVRRHRHGRRRLDDPHRRHGHAGVVQELRRRRRRRADRRRRHADGVAAFGHTQTTNPDGNGFDDIWLVRTNLDGMVHFDAGSGFDTVNGAVQWSPPRSTSCCSWCRRPHRSSTRR